METWFLAVVLLAAAAALGFALVKFLRGRSSGMRRLTFTVVGTAVVLLCLGGIGALTFLYSGVYDIAASRPHLSVVRWAVTTLQVRSVEEHAERIDPPSLADPILVRQGFDRYREWCVVCHGAPGVARSQIGRGINPSAPPLYAVAPQWSDAELYWIIENGLKMAGMPAFKTTLAPEERWALVAFLRRATELSPQEYGAMVAASEGRAAPSRVEWVSTEPPAYALLSQGDPEEGEAIIEKYGCDACHTIPGVPGANGKAGPPLDQWGKRHFIAGRMVNNPTNLMAWIVNPQAIEPGTAMPNLGVSAEEALHVAAYLFTLGEPSE